MNNGLYDEEDDVLDEDLFASDNDNDTEEELEQDDTFEIAEGTYKMNSITPSFLKIESSIKCESSKTEIKFSYRGETYKGIVLQQMSNPNDYVFLVQFAGKSIRKNETNEKKLKKIHIPDASLIG